MLNPDSIPAEFAFPLAIVLVLIWAWLEARAKRSSEQIITLDSYTTIDCRDSRHVACTGCACHCHAAQYEAPNLEFGSQR